MPHNKKCQLDNFLDLAGLTLFPLGVHDRSDPEIAFISFCRYHYALDKKAGDHLSIIPALK
jgi:hypothetical protein